MVDRKFEDWSLCAAAVLFFIPFFNLFFSVGSSKNAWLVLLAIGVWFFVWEFGRLVALKVLGKPIPFYRLKRGQVYEVVAKTSASDLIIIMGPEKQSKMIVIPPFLEKDLKEGEKFVKVDLLTINKVS